jgi:hypothetical protein
VRAAPPRRVHEAQQLRTSLPKQPTGASIAPSVGATTRTSDAWTTSGWYSSARTAGSSLARLGGCWRWWEAGGGRAGSDTDTDSASASASCSSSSSPCVCKLELRALWRPTLSVVAVVGWLSDCPSAACRPPAASCSDIVLANSASSASVARRSNVILSSNRRKLRVTSDRHLRCLDTTACAYQGYYITI